MIYLSEIAKATGGTLAGQDVLIQSVGTDSRKLEAGQLFVALKGERFDGHAYASEVLKQGAVAVLVSSPVDATPVVLVEDTRLALGQLAAYWRAKFHIPVAAVTGSNGKTSVKEMLASILRVAAGSDDAVLATQGNLNNDIGLPLTLLRLREQHRYAVVEMGMNHFGEISYLTHIGRPDVALINNATSAHLGGLGSVEGVARAKGEIFEGLVESGVAVINLDDHYAGLWQSLAGKHQVLTFGLDSAEADVTAQYVLHADGSDLQLSTPSGDRTLSLPVPGIHNVRNALAATAVALSVGVLLDEVVAGLASFSGVKGRLQRKAGKQQAVLIDDTYNANPASMKAAIDVLAKQPGKRLLVVGDMGELGENESALHAELGRYAKAASLDGLYALGALTATTVEAYGNGASHYDAVDELVTTLLPELGANTSVLVKGSRFMRMERVVELLQDQKEKS